MFPLKDFYDSTQNPCIDIVFVKSLQEMQKKTRMNPPWPQEVGA